MLDHEKQMLIVDRVCHESWITGQHYRMRADEAAMPHVLMRPRVFLEKPGVWCAMYGECLADSPAGFGSSPYAACADFDRRWLYSQEQIDKCEAERSLTKGALHA